MIILILSITYNICLDTYNDKKIFITTIKPFTNLTDILPLIMISTCTQCMLPPHLRVESSTSTSTL